ncbi:MAG: GNAT family N-acetyltransferase [Polyangiaceae bacterium]
MLTFRPARPSDLDALLEIHLAAFPDPRGLEARRRNFVDNPLGSFDDLHVAAEDDVPVAHAFAFPLTTHYGGRPVRTLGIASVGVAPHARGVGVAKALLQHLHEFGRARHDAIAMLYAFRQGFYARVGYAAASSRKRLVFAPAAIPRSFVTGDFRMRPATFADRGALESLFAEMLDRVSGRFTRDSRAWDRRLLDERRLFALADDGTSPKGYVAYSLVQTEAHAETTLVVEELVATSDASERALLGFLRNFRDQATSVTLEIDERSPLDRLLVDAARHRHGTESFEHTVGAIGAGPMVHVLDAEAALSARGYLADGTLDFVVDGRRFGLVVERGRGRVTSGDASSAGSSALAMDGPTFSAITFGSLAVRDAARFGLVQGPVGILPEADRILGLPPVHALETF